jgi:hypothetical protein
MKSIFLTMVERTSCGLASYLVSLEKNQILQTIQQEMQKMIIFFFFLNVHKRDEGGFKLVTFTLLNMVPTD